MSHRPSGSVTQVGLLVLTAALNKRETRDGHDSTAASSCCRMFVSRETVVVSREQKTHLSPAAAFFPPVLFVFFLFFAFSALLTPDSSEFNL